MMAATHLNKVTKVFWKLIRFKAVNKKKHFRNSLAKEKMDRGSPVCKKCVEKLRNNFRETQNSKNLKSHHHQNIISKSQRIWRNLCDQGQGQRSVLVHKQTGLCSIKILFGQHVLRAEYKSLFL